MAGNGWRSSLRTGGTRSSDDEVAGAEHWLGHPPTCCRRALFLFNRSTLAQRSLRYASQVELTARRTRSSRRASGSARQQRPSATDGRRVPAEEHFQLPPFQVLEPKRRRWAWGSGGKLVAQSFRCCFASCCCSAAALLLLLLPQLLLLLRWQRCQRLRPRKAFPCTQGAFREGGAYERRAGVGWLRRGTRDR